MEQNDRFLLDLARPMLDLCSTYGNESEKALDYYPPMYIGGSRATDMSGCFEGENCSTQKEAIR